MYAMEEKLLTVEEVAESLNVSRDVIWKAIRQKSLIAYRVEGALRIHPRDLRAYLDKRRTNQQNTQTE